MPTASAVRKSTKTRKEPDVKLDGVSYRQAKEILSWKGEPIRKALRKAKAGVSRIEIPGTKVVVFIDGRASLASVYFSSPEGNLYRALHCLSNLA